MDTSDPGNNAGEPGNNTGTSSNVAPSSINDSGNKNLVLGAVGVVAIIGVIVVLVVIFKDGNGGGGGESCIKLPEKMTESVKKPTFEMATELEAIKIDGNLKASYEQVSKTAFAEIGKCDVAFLLLLRAIDCYLTKSKGDKDQQELLKAIIPELIITARAMWAECHDLKGGDGRLSVEEISILNKSDNGAAILKELKTYGISD